MNDVKQVVAGLQTDSRGATAIEYALIAALIALALIGGLGLLGESNQGSWAGTANKASNAMTTP